jgi:hypothetical protein
LHATAWAAEAQRPAAGLEQLRRGKTGNTLNPLWAAVSTFTFRAIATAANGLQPFYECTRIVCTVRYLRQCQ